jgi:hypothetical protein
MNIKHYVSLEVAKMLKEKGHNKYGYTECTWSYDGNSKEWKLVYTADKRFQGHHLSFVYYAPTLLEAMDWLEERGIRMELHWKRETGWWYLIRECAPEYIVDFADSTYFIDRNECMNEAIKKGLELL